MGLISVKEARKLIEENFRKGDSEVIVLKSALNRILSMDVYSPSNVPSFHNSAMDGYAFCFDDWNRNPLPVFGESAAGAKGLPELMKGTAMRIFTGAPLPSGADTVVMQEKVELADSKLIIRDEKLIKGANIRMAGSQTQVNDLAMHSGRRLTAGSIGFLASLGIEKVSVVKLPNVSIIVTGSEIVDPGKELQFGQVYECNSYSLIGALGGFGIAPSVQYCADEPQLVARAVETALETADILLITGGVSVGDYDFVVPALNHAAVQQVFHKIAQKPAKPMYFGVNNSCAVFGLPGNPASVLTSFYLYVQPFVLAFLRVGQPWKFSVSNSISTYKRMPGITQFLKAHSFENKVEILDGQESYKMNSFVDANCFVEVDENCSFIQPGDSVRIIYMNPYD